MDLKNKYYLNHITRNQFNEPNSNFNHKEILQSMSPKDNGSEGWNKKFFNIQDEMEKKRHY